MDARNASHDTSRYIDDFLRLKCAPDILSLGVYPNGKEITEAIGVWRAIRDLLGGPESCGRSDVTVVAIGDGRQPRLGILCAMRARWRAVSIDPILRADWTGTSPKGVNRLHGIAKRIEACGRRHFPGTLVLAFPHSHAPVPEALDRLTGDQRHVVALPCCRPTEVPGRVEPDQRWVDDAIWSGRREMMVWRTA